MPSLSGSRSQRKEMIVLFLRALGEAVGEEEERRVLLVEEEEEEWEDERVEVEERRVVEAMGRISRGSLL
jgi:hypothetical protein